MGPNKEKIYNYLFACQKRFGGYTGRNLGEIARITEYDRRTVKRNVEKWTKTDPRFTELKYIDQHFVSITIEDIAILNQHLKKNIMGTKQDIIQEINDNRIKRGDISISQSTLYWRCSDISLTHRTLLIF